MKAFRKRVYSIKTFFTAMFTLYGDFGKLKTAWKRKFIDRSFTERIMLAVTQVNGCRFCSFGHTQAALSAGMSKQEIEEILDANFEQVPPDQKIALFFAQYCAENNGNYGKEQYNRLQKSYGTEAGKDILVYTRFMIFGNLCGNTLEALLLRFTGKKIQNSTVFNELVVVLSMILILPVVFILGILFK